MPRTKNPAYFSRLDPLDRFFERFRRQASERILPQKLTVACRQMTNGTIGTRSQQMDIPAIWKTRTDLLQLSADPRGDRIGSIQSRGQKVFHPLDILRLLHKFGVSEQFQALLFDGSLHRPPRQQRPGNSEGGQYRDHQPPGRIPARSFREELPPRANLYAQTHLAAIMPYAAARKSRHPHCPAHPTIFPTLHEPISDHLKGLA